MVGGRQGSQSADGTEDLFRLRRALKNMPFLPVQGGEIYYEASGSGTPLVLIHAGFLDSRMWDKEFAALSKSHLVIRYDVRGYGKSSRPKTEYSDFEDLFSLLTHLKVGKAIVLGVSNGGRIAFDFVSTHPEMVRALLLASPGIRGYQGSGEREDKASADLEKKGDLQDKAIGEGRIEDAVRMDLEIWAPVSQAGPDGGRLHQIALENSHIHRDPPGRLQKSPQPPAFTRLGSINVPVLLMVGDKDVEIMRLISERLHSLIPGSRFELIEGADHIANVSRPSEFDSLVSSFLQGLNPLP